MILVINCSPVRNGATAEIVNYVSNYLGKDHEVHSVCIDDYDIHFCKGCRTCHKTAVCMQKDDVTGLMEQFEWADQIIAVAPSYWADVPGQFKAFIDRCTPWCNTHEPHASLRPGKKGYVIALRTGPSSRECDKIIETINHFFGHLEMETCNGLGLCSIEFKEEVADRIPEIQDFCDRMITKNVGEKKNMQKGLNFRTIEGQETYFNTYNKSLKLISVPVEEKYIATSYGESHVLCCGEEKNPPLVLLHAASCGSSIWYKNIPVLSNHFRIYAIDLIGESSKSILTKKLSTPADSAKWLEETLEGLQLQRITLCGLSIGGWNAANYATFYQNRVEKLILLSPVQTFAKMYSSYFFKIMKMGFHPTRENVENYIGWGSAKEDPLPDSIIEQFTLSVMNMNSNASFPKWIAKKQLTKIKVPVLVMFGEKEFAFSVDKATKRAKEVIRNLDLEVLQSASHLLPVSKPDYVNSRIISFINKQ